MTQLPDFNHQVTKILSSTKVQDLISPTRIQYHYQKLVGSVGSTLQSKTSADIKKNIGYCFINLITIATAKELTVTKQVPKMERAWPVLTSNTFIVLGKMAEALCSNANEGLQDLVDDLTALLMLWASNSLLDVEECLEAACNDKAW